MCRISSRTLLRAAFWSPQWGLMLLEDNVTDLMQTCVLGIDVGTGGTRAVIIDGRGRILASATEEHEPFASPKVGWAEQRPEDWWRAAGLAIRKALALGKLRGEQIACVGFSGQMHGAVMLDGSGQVVRPALIWCDVRTDQQCRELNEKIVPA